jgi:pyruvate dehydrogenase complex dehydrogenase (E1) component
VDRDIKSVFFGVDVILSKHSEAITLYDPFIKRGLDALNYACYQDARFILVATPSGITLAPEGGAVSRSASR